MRMYRWLSGGSISTRAVTELHFSAIWAQLLPARGHTAVEELVLGLEAQVEVLPLVRVHRGRCQHAQVGRVPRQLLRILSAAVRAGARSALSQPPQISG